MKYEKALEALEPLERNLHKALDELRHARKHNRGQGVTEARLRAEDAEAELEQAYQKALDCWRTLPTPHPAKETPPVCEALKRAEQVI